MKWRKPNLAKKSQVIVKRLNNPCATLQSIGTEVGFTRERVRQILSTHNLPTVALRIKKLTQCLNCGKPIDYRRKFCGIHCFSAYSRIWISCSECGGMFWMHRSHLIYRINTKAQKRFFCSHQCQGKWLGTNYRPATPNKKKVIVE